MGALVVTVPLDADPVESQLDVAQVFGGEDHVDRSQVLLQAVSLVVPGMERSRAKPANLDLRRMYLKNCDLRGLSLAGADLRESNLSLSDLRGVDLRAADLSGSDLEGVKFSGADLTDADLSDTALSATRFVDDSGEAILHGAVFEGSYGLVEEQEEFVRTHT